MFWAEIWKISEFFIWKCSIFGHKIFSIYLNRCFRNVTTSLVLNNWALNWSYGYPQHALLIESSTFTTVWAHSADDKWMILFLFFPENRIWRFMQIVSTGNNLHEMSKSVCWEKEEKYFSMSSAENFSQHANVWNIECLIMVQVKGKVLEII